MAREHIIYCDICGKKESVECSFYVDRRLDAAGSMDDEFEHMDLCRDHLLTAFQLAQTQMNFEKTRGVYAALKGRAAANKKKPET